MLAASSAGQTIAGEAGTLAGWFVLGSPRLAAANGEFANAIKNVHYYDELVSTIGLWNEPFSEEPAPPAAGASLLTRHRALTFGSR